MGWRAVACGAVAALAFSAACPARADGCEEAWYQRNVLYKEAGYCFRTPAAIQAFGNAGCRYDSVEDVPLSARQRAAVAEIAAYEARMGCRRR